VEKVTITLDGREVTGIPGMTILDIARESGVTIPTLCYHPYLSPSGACRLCLVENERSGALLASCVTPIEAGMLISTTSPRVLARRKEIVELMLASHPDTCMVCDKGNRCELHRIASDLGVGVLAFDKIPQYGAIIDMNPFIVRDMSKCILCGRCVRADQELVVEGALDYFGRGFTSHPATLGEAPLERSECTFCGTCVAMCPTGALSERNAISTGSTSKSVATTCPFCGCGCSVVLETRGDTIIRGRPGDGSPVNRGTLCVRGAYGYDFVHSPERLTTPLIRGPDGLEAVSWEEALNLASAELGRLKRDAGPAALAVLGSPSGTNEENYLLQRFARCVLGTPNIDNGARLHRAPSYTGIGGTLGYPGTIGTITDIECAEVILVAGADPAASAPAVAYAIKRAVTRKGALLLLLEPRKTQLARFAHLWLRPRPGTDIALINGLAASILGEGLVDRELVTTRTDGFSELVESLGRYTPQYVERIAGVSAGDLTKAARTFGGAHRAVIIYGGGVTRSWHGTDTVKALANLALLTGNVERKGTGLYALQARNNAQGACDMGAMPDLLPGYCSADDREGRRRFEERWECGLPTGSGLTAIDAMTAAAAGQVRGMMIVGENPVGCFPDPDTVERGLRALDFLLVQDIFLTETAALATVVLPAASFAEKDGSFTNFEGRVQPVCQALPPYCGSRPDWQIILALAEAMGSPLPFEGLDDIEREIIDLVPFYEGAGAGGDGGPGAGAYTEPWAKRRLHEWLFPSTFGRFLPVDYVAEEGVSDEYPLTLVTGSSLYQFGTGSRTSRSTRLSSFAPQPYVEISATDAGRLGIDDGEEVQIVSTMAAVGAVARVTDVQPVGVVFAPLASPDGRVNRLFPAIVDPQSKTPALGHVAVRLERRLPDV
jgi:formate dehydrogenase alpha subunit